MMLLTAGMPAMADNDNDGKAQEEEQYKEIL